MQQDSAYFLEASAKTRNLGLAMSLILVIVLPVFLYLDSTTPQLHGIRWWRIGATVPALIFVFYAFFLFPKHRRFAIPLHMAQLAGLMIMMCGISAELAARPEFPQFGRTALISSLIICIFADFAFAAGARKYLGAILMLPLAAMSVYLVAAGKSLTHMELLWIIINPVTMAVVLSALALYQERSSAKEFTVRSELKRAEGALRESEKKYHELFENAEVGMFQMEPRGLKIIDVNRTCLELTGRAREEMIGSSSAIHWADPREHEEMMRVLARDGHVTSFECRIVNVRGKDRSCIASLSPHSELQVLEGSLLDITERKRLEAEREGMLQRLEFVMATTQTGLDIIDEGYVVQYVDPARRRVFGDPRGQCCYEYFRGKSSPCDGCAMQDALKTRQVQIREQTPPSSNRPTQTTSLPYQDDSGKWFVAEVLVDISERKRVEAERLDLERHMAESQRLEGLGILAGGVAHNFNNLLTVILGHAELLKEALPRDPATTSSVQEILKAGDRSRELVSRLLSLGRRQVLELRPLDVNAVIRESGAMLRQALRENISLDHRLSTSPCPVAADPARIEQVLLNLALNAQDAMPREGRIEIATTEVLLEGALARRYNDLPPGRYVQLGFSDTGQGMDKETLTKIFTPFFTTKEQGKGTGLGLFTVYGIVKQHNGTIEVESHLGAGTRFSIYLPRIELPAEEAPPAREMPRAEGRETIVLVEDEEPIRRMLSHQLRSLGYTVMEASDGIAALQTLSEHGKAAHILVTDVVMPGMNGTDLRDHLRKQMPHLKVLFMSGYAKEVLSSHFPGEKDMELMTKPFTGRALASRIREILDGQK